LIGWWTVADILSRYSAITVRAEYFPEEVIIFKRATVQTLSVQLLMLLLATVTCSMVANSNVYRDLSTRNLKRQAVRSVAIRFQIVFRI
jgi:hypothetical protein